MFRVPPRPSHRKRGGGFHLGREKENIEKKRRKKEHLLEDGLIEAGDV